MGHIFILDVEKKGKKWLIKRKSLGILACFTLLLLIVGRILYVNWNARIPVYNQISQGQSFLYCGLQYRIIRAELWDYKNFFMQDEDLVDFMDDSTDMENQKVLLLELQINSTEESCEIVYDMPVQMRHTCNWSDMFLTQFINPVLKQGTFHSGDTILLPYIIYRENLTDTQWEQVEDLSMQYSIVLSTYPVKNELMVTDVIRMTGKGETDE